MKKIFKESHMETEGMDAGERIDSTVFSKLTVFIPAC